MKIAVVTDSTAYLTAEECRELGVVVLPLSITFQGKQYAEGEDITNEQFYEMVRHADVLPKSSQPAPGRVYEVFEQLTQQYDAIIAIHLSGKISGTYQTTASITQEFDAVPIYAIDSLRSCGAQAQLVREAVRLARAGVPAEEIVSRIEKLRDQQTVYFVVDNLHHLQKGGRLSAGAAMMGSMLKIKPILTINGEISIFEKVRTLPRVLTRVAELLDQEVAKGVPLTATVHHAHAAERAAHWQQTLQELYPQVTFITAPFGPVIGTHLGEGAIGLTISPTTSA